jgi:hypothetical protein
MMTMVNERKGGRFCDGKEFRKKEKSSDHVTCDCVSGWSSILPSTSFIVHYLFNMPRTAETPFVPPKTRKTVKSSNPKTVLNRTYASAKRGLDISDYRDDGAYRSKKYRALKKLRSCKGWADMSTDEQATAEEMIVRKLEEERDSKKKIHEREWIKKTENGEIKSDEDDLIAVDEEDVGSDSDDGKSNWKGVESAVAVDNDRMGSGGDESEWSTDDDKEDVDRLTRELVEIKNKASERYMATVAKWEEVGKKEWGSEDTL